MKIKAVVAAKIQDAKVSVHRNKRTAANERKQAIKHIKYKEKEQLK